MSNLLSIEVVESRTAGSNEPFEFSVVASDNYGKAIDNGYSSMEELLESHPTRLDLLEWVETQSEFSGSFAVKGSKVILESVSMIDFAGYPEDDSITEIKREEFEVPSEGWKMNNAYQATEDDVENVLCSNSLAVANTNGKSFESIANEVFGSLDFDLIEQAALFGNDLNEQTDYANDEIARQLREMGILEPLKESYIDSQVG